MLSSLSLPNDMLVDDLSRFLDGFDQCCRKYACPVVGGNVKEAEEFRCEATVIGRVQGDRPLSRHGAKVGDYIVAIGKSGYFWSAYLSISENLKPNSVTQSELIDAIVKPTPQIALGCEMSERGMTRASTDASDGLYYAVHSLTVSQGLGFCIDRSMIHFPALVREVAGMAGVDPLRLLLGFGDLQLVLAIGEGDIRAVQAVTADANEQLLVLGVVTDTGRLELLDNGIVHTLSNFDNERLTAESQFTGGMSAYKQRLLERPLTI
jgi:thiamine-monophosphate kinase